jgi:hypothetical protein
MLKGLLKRYKQLNIEANRTVSIYAILLLYQGLLTFLYVIHFQITG